METDSQLRRKVRDLINDGCIARVPEGSKELPSLGGHGYYVWQFYLRRALLDPLCLQVLCDDFWQKFHDRFASRRFQLAGVESAAVPIITALVIDWAKRGRDLNAFTIRKNRKTYGKRNLIEGMPTEEPVLFIDDLTSPQHNAFWHAMHTLSLHGLSISGHGYVLVLKMKSQVPPLIETSMGPVVLDSLFTLDDFSLTLEAYNAEKAQAAGGGISSEAPLYRGTR